MMDELYSKFVGALWGMLLCLMVSMLAGCGAKKPAVLTRTDSVRVTKVVKDTVYWDREVLRYVERAKTDKTWSRDSTATTVDEEGNVKKTDAWHWRDRYVENSLNTLMKDSLETYKAMVDSLANIGRKNNDVPELVGEKHRKAHRVLHRCHNNRRCGSADSQICERKAEEQREERMKGNCLDY